MRGGEVHCDERSTVREWENGGSERERKGGRDG